MTETIIRVGPAILLALALTTAARGETEKPGVPGETTAESGAATSENEQPVRKKPATSKGMESMLEQEHGVFGRRMVIEPSFTYARFDRAQLNLSGFLALDAIFLGSISVDEIEADILTYNLAGRFGWTERLQLTFGMPFVYRNTNYQSGGAGGAGTTLVEEDRSAGPRLGDVSAGFSYQLYPETRTRPDMVFSMTVKAPTGEDPYGIGVIEVENSQGNLTIPESLPSGNGVWAVSTALSFVKTVDPVVLFGNISYFYNLEEDFDDIASAAGDQPGTIKLGNSVQLGLGMALALNESTSLSISYSQRHTSNSRQKGEGGSFSTVTGSDATASLLDFGLTYAISDRLSVVTSVGAGLTADAADVQFTMKLPYVFY